MEDEIKLITRILVAIGELKDWELGIIRNIFFDKKDIGEIAKGYGVDVERIKKIGARIIDTIHTNVYGVKT